MAIAASAALGVGIAEAIPASARTERAKASTAASVLGNKDVAKGKPVLFGAINIETQASANFPEVREAANAMINYVNTYRGGLNGHPIKVKWCITDGSPSVSSSCAKQLIAAHPVAILGAADISGAAPLSLYAKAHLAVIGGTNFTPPESTAKNSLIFTDVASFSNIQNALWAAHLGGGKKAKVAVLAEGDAQGEFQASSSWVPAVQSVGGQVKVFDMPPSASDLSADIEAAISWGANSIGLESPGQCVQLLTGLKTDGWTGPVTSIDPCSAPPTIQAANGAANGMYFMGSLQLLNSGTPDAKLAAAIIAKYAPKLPYDSPAAEELSTVMNIWSAFHATPIKKLTSAHMLRTLRSGQNHPNFLSVPYTCNGKAIPNYPDVCDSNYYLYQIKNGQSMRVGKKVYNGGANLIKAS
jgi:branched-chain amino acid transport system substrate-binding protein